MGSPNGFSYEVRANGDVVITHHGGKATVLRGGRAAEFLSIVEPDAQDADPRRADAQETMARWTGNYKHGNERTAKQHPRNRG